MPEVGAGDTSGLAVGPESVSGRARRIRCVAASVSATDSLSLSAATSRAVRAGSGRAATRAVNARSRRSPSGAVGPRPPWSAVTPGSSISASGFPAACSRIRSRAAGARPGAVESSSSAAACPESLPAVITGSPASRRGEGSPSRRAAIMTMGSDSIRRATKARTSALARSSQCASSATTSSGRSAATSASRVSVASPTT